MSDDVEYLYGLVSGVNVPFNSLTTEADLDSSNNQWLLRHAFPYLHYKIRLTAGDNNNLDIFITLGAWNILVYRWDGNESAAHTYSGYINLEDLTTWVIGVGPGSGDTDIYQGEWAAGSFTRYDIVYHATNEHYWYADTNTSEEPTGTPSDWTDLGTAVNLWTDGSRYQMFVDTSLNSSFTLTVDYLLESDQTSL